MSKRSQHQANRRKARVKKKQRHLLHVKAGKVSDVPAEDSACPNEVSITELEAIIDRAAKGPLNEQDRQLLLSVSQTLHFLTEQLEKKSTTIGRLRKLLFGASTESLKNVAGETPADDKTPEKEPAPPQAPPDDASGESEKPKGHGRNGAKAYTGAQKINIPHETLKPGDPCPDCRQGTVYEMAEPGHRVRVTGQTPLQATVYELQRLRCGLCGKVFTATAPPEVGPEKYDAESVSMIALLKYGCGVPFNRLQRLQETLGVPLAASTQWETTSEREQAFVPVYQALIETAAQGKVLHNDDTTMRVLDRKDLKPAGDGTRQGIFTSGIVSVDDDHQIALFFTGHQHAGENLGEVLKRRVCELTAPIQMSDALSRNVPGEFRTLLANCLAHGRRKFVDVYQAFPSECHTVLEGLAQVYKHDEQARKEGLSDAERLAYHQLHSGPVMADLKAWMSRQLEEHLVEPNSGLGEAIGYMLNHWEALTLFLREPGAPLDNNLCERALKKAILHRKNAYFYKTANGARVGDMFMSLIHTCELTGTNPFEYLTALQKHAEAVAAAPSAWLPWNHREALPQEQPSAKTV